MSITIPEADPTFANNKLKAIIAMANMAQPKLATEINAAGSLDITAHMFADGWTPAAATSKGTARRRLAARRSIERINTTTYSMGALQYTHRPKLLNAAAGNEARQLLQRGLKIYLGEGQGIDGETGAFAVGDQMRTHYVLLGDQIWSGDQTDENGEFFITQEAVYVTPAGPVIGVVVA